MVSRAKNYVINAFAACDMDGNKSIDINEWTILT